MNENENNHSESLEHIKIKEYLHNNIPLVNPIKIIEQEYRVGDQIIDLFVKLQNNRKIAIEIQHSKISKMDLLRRTKNYNQKGISVLWILNGNGPYYCRVPINQNGIIISSSERALHNMYQGRVYYINMAKDKVKTPIYALHFASYYEQKIDTHGLFHYKKSLIKRSISWTPIPSLNLKIVKNGGLYLACFKDQNMKQRLERELVNLFNIFISYQSKTTNTLKLPGLPLGFVFHKYSKTYGKFLLFDVLRQLKFLRFQDLKYIMNNKLQSQKFLLT